MKKILKSKGFVVTTLSLLCVVILGVCWFVGRDRSGTFLPDQPPPSSVTGEWSDGGNIGSAETDTGAYSPGNTDVKAEEYPKVVEEKESEVVINFTSTEKPEQTAPPAPEGKTVMENPGPEHPVQTDPAVTSPSEETETAKETEIAKEPETESKPEPAKETEQAKEPEPGTDSAPPEEPKTEGSPENGAVYDPVFGWVVPSKVNQIPVDSDGDPNKMVGNMGE